MLKRILEISKKLNLNHIGSCTSVLPVLDEIYKQKKKKDKVVMSGAHAHLAHLVVKEKYEGLKDIEELIKKDIHCTREVGCDATGGSLAHSGIAIGLALANRKRNVYLIMTDGSLGEGEEWEVLRIKRELKLDNLYVYVSANGYTAVSVVDIPYLIERLVAFCPDVQIRLNNNYKNIGIEGHYLTYDQIK